MNARIQKLFDEAQGSIDPMDDPANVFEKFAQLIAKDCADICMEMYAKCAGLSGDGVLAKDCAYWIKKDFGVEP